MLANLRKRLARSPRVSAPAGQSGTPEAGVAATAATGTTTPMSASPQTRSIEGACAVCGRDAVFERGTGSVLGNFTCPHCRATLRYQGQAAALVRCYARHGARSLAALVKEPEFAKLRIYEPGDRGALARFLREVPGHMRTVYRTEVAPGESVDGVRSEDLMALTFDTGSFDLVITSDIMEHVRHPFVGFAEIHRVLTPGGYHVFTIPVRHPMRATTIPRVDVSSADDVFLVEPTYHNSHLVYNDFGHDMLVELDAVGFETEVLRFESPDEEAATQLTFCSRKL
jgi:SAM-dependent methyltransferase